MAQGRGRGPCLNTALELFGCILYPSKKKRSRVSLAESDAYNPTRDP